MAKVLDLTPLGVRVELLRTAEDTGGELFEFDVVGRARGLIAGGHVHTEQSERLEVLSGAMKLTIDGRKHLLRPGQAMEVAPGTPHRQQAAGKGDGRVRVQARPAGDTEAFLERLEQMCRAGDFNHFGYPKPAAGARLMRDFASTGHATRPPLPVQRAFANVVLGLAESSRPYVFVDEWDVAAPPEAVFSALADARTYPAWWRPVYIDVESDGPAELGKESRQHFKGRLPYHLNTRSVITELDPPRTITAEVDGDLRGTGTWTLTPIGVPTAADVAVGGGPQGGLIGTHVRFDWQVHADRKLLRTLTPLLRPLFRWNHDWAIARAMEGLEPFAQQLASAAAPAHTTIA
jgi:quercetin dioxygenase-like cupin family protein/uncharacterized protein YndB with AHSA1/START domain